MGCLTEDVRVLTHCFPLSFVGRVIFSGAPFNIFLACGVGVGSTLFTSELERQTAAPRPRSTLATAAPQLTWPGAGWRSAGPSLPCFCQNWGGAASPATRRSGVGLVRARVRADGERRVT